MRIWSVHPTYLDSKGLVALWREGLLAFHVLSGNTKGYINHPQLLRFKNHAEPIEAINTYLHAIVDEAEKRGYSFKREKLLTLKDVPKIPVTLGQLNFEIEHLRKKLFIRDKKIFELYKLQQKFEHHPLFELIEGEVEEWEKITK